MSKAYAIADETGIIINTVHAHARGAMVNWICLYMRANLPASVSDENIRAVFQQLAPLAGVELWEVNLEKDRHMNPARVDLLAPAPQGPTAAMPCDPLREPLG